MKIPNSEGWWYDGWKVYQIIPLNDVKGGRLVVDLGSGMHTGLDAGMFEGAVWQKVKLIHCWHGRDQKIEQKIAAICRKQDDNYFYFGSLDDFEKLWNDKFIVYPQFIGVTQFNNFGQR